MATEATEMGIWKWSLRTNRVEWDQQMFRIYGLPMTAEGGVSYEDWRLAVLPEDLPRQDELTNEALRRKGQRVREFRILRPNDGEVRIIRSVDVARINESGEVGWFVATTDPQGKITFVNDQFTAISQYSREELLGQDHRIINSGFHPKGFFRDLWTTITSGKVWKGEIKNRAKDGTFYWVDTTIVPFLDERGKPTQFIAIRADISPRKEAEEALRRLNVSLEQRVAERTAELERSNHDLEQFAYIASHDLQEPLRGVGGCVQILRSRYHGKLDARADELITHTIEGVTRMQALINDLLAYSQVGRGLGDRENVPAAKSAEAALVNLRGAIRNTGAVITCGDLPTVTVALVELGQLFQNLIGNAIKYRARERVPQIHVSAKRDANMWRFSVRDNGIGIEPQYYERIFGIFQRLHTRRDYPGTGIGLAVCKKIVESWGGRIGVQSIPGEGSEFWFTVPSHPGA